MNQSWRHPEGWQAVVRAAGDRSQVLIVLHALANAPAHVAIPLPDGDWRIVEEFGEIRQQPQQAGKIAGQQLICPIDGDWSARVMLLVQEVA